MKKHRLPRKVKKVRKKAFKGITLTITKIPKGVSVEKWMSYFDTGIVWYTESNSIDIEKIKES